MAALVGSSNANKAARSNIMGIPSWGNHQKSRRSRLLHGPNLARKG
jgi:hypothetical protein